MRRKLLLLVFLGGIGANIHALSLGFGLSAGMMMVGDSFSLETAAPIINLLIWDNYNRNIDLIISNSTVKGTTVGLTMNAVVLDVPFIEMQMAGVSFDLGLGILAVVQLPPEGGTNIFSGIRMPLRINTDFTDQVTLFLEVAPAFTLAVDTDEGTLTPSSVYGSVLQIGFVKWF